MAFVESSRIHGYADKLVQAWCLAYLWVLRYCKSDVGVREVCSRLKNSMELFMSSQTNYVLGIAPCQLVDEGEQVNAVYLAYREAGHHILLVSYTVLEDPVYASFVLLHEIAHHIGFDDEDLADLIALMVAEENVHNTVLELLEKPPVTVKQVIDEAIRSGNTCNVKDLDNLLDKGVFIGIRGFNCSNL